MVSCGSPILPHFYSSYVREVVSIMIRREVFTFLFPQEKMETRTPLSVAIERLLSPRSNL